MSIAVSKEASLRAVSVGLERPKALVGRLGGVTTMADEEEEEVLDESFFA